MIITLTSDEISVHPDLFDQMFRLRAHVFKDRLGWDVTVENGWEKDAFDAFDPLYVMSVSQDRKVLYGACRLLPTSGPHMMSEVFGVHFEPDAVLRSPLIWEITRFCTSDTEQPPATPSGLNMATIQLLAGTCELGMASGISHVTAVFEPLMGRVYRRAGLKTSIIGKTSSLGAKPVFAGLWELNEATLQSLRRSGGFQGSVLSPPGDTGHRDKKGHAA